MHFTYNNSITNSSGYKSLIIYFLLELLEVYFQYILVSRDECPGANAIALVSALASASVSACVCVNKNYNLGHKFLTRSNMAFILQMCIPCDKTFHLEP